MIIKPPTKPFDDYKWRWAEYTPTETLNQPACFLGVLRTLYEHQGKSSSDSLILRSLEKVETEISQLLDIRVRLARTTARNLLRSSGRYWKALGVLEESRIVKLTSFGEKVASGMITQSEFAIAVIKSLTLPNRHIDSNITKWEKAQLEIKPLEVIISILNQLADYSEKEAFLTPFELVKIVIPLAGIKADIEEYTTALIAFRNNKLNLANWPDCAPRANDKRMAREFLLFLANYGFCRIAQQELKNEQQQYFLQTDYANEATEILELVSDSNMDNIVHLVRNTPSIFDSERHKVLTEVLARPQQAKFRQQVLKKYNSTCLMTGEQLSPVLQACHIIPVKDKGSDDISNSLCLRADIHILFDLGHIRIKPEGHLRFSETIKQSVSYSDLPNTIQIPDFVSSKAIHWRWMYY
ncbi:MAG: hypothetical protein DRR08_16070 [Candidatus Parabeggiatoa sp. nov. 2]|nr:MAG: hypothetical protein DRR08_16070 [Gammaproteobacteria bacterium]